MAGLRELRRRIRAIRNTQRITKAMRMIAAAKLMKAQARVVAARPYARRLRQTLGRLVAATPADHPLLVRRAEGARVHLVITGNRGLAGPYNANVIRRALTEMAGGGHDAAAVAVGRKGRDALRRRGIRLVGEYLALGEEPTYAQARQIAGRLMDLYKSGEAAEVHVIYTEFVSALNQRPRSLCLLPVTAEAEDDAAAGDGTPGGIPGAAPGMEYIYEPSAAEVLDALLPRYVEMLVYGALLEAKASEHGARMTAMGSASDNAGEMIEALTGTMNRLRQATITREIAEIVGGAEALKQG